MDIRCVWEHNGADTLLYADNFPGAFTRGADLESAQMKMRTEVQSYLKWAGIVGVDLGRLDIVQDSSCGLNVRDADSDVLFDSEIVPLSNEEYADLKALALKSAADFQRLYESVPDKFASDIPFRDTFYGAVPRNFKEMYQHTQNVNAYYFGEIEVEADNGGDILSCRIRGFEALENQPDFLSNQVFDGSYGEKWTLRKVLRRFIWHDRIHAKAMYRMAARIFGAEKVCNPFGF